MYLYERQLQEKREQEKIREMLHPIAPPKKDIRHVALMGSMSHTYGNALAYIQNWIIDLFPKDMFKTIHVNSKIAHRQLRGTTQEFLKKTKPMIVFRPRIPDINEEKFLQDTLLIERMTDIYSTYAGTNLQPFFQDPMKEIAIKYQMNRTVMYVDVSVILSTLMQQLDYFHYIENAVRINHPFMLSTCFESFLPEEMLQVVSDCVGIPIYDGHGNTKEFLEYMNGKSGYPITYKLTGSTRQREFYRYYPVNIDTIITDLDKDEGERVGNVMSQYQITFTVRMEFYSTGFYYLFSNKIDDIKLPQISPEDSTVIPVFTDVFQKEDLNLRQGWVLYNRGSCRLDDGDTSVNIDQMFNDSIREALRYHKMNGLPIFDFIEVKVRKQGVLMKEGYGYNINWDTYDITFDKQDTYHTYTILICINVEYVNTLIKYIYNLK